MPGEILVPLIFVYAANRHRMPPIVPRDLDSRFITALQAEFIGTLLFQFLAALSGSAWGNGLSFAVLGAISGIIRIQLHACILLSSCREAVPRTPGGVVRMLRHA